MTGTYKIRGNRDSTLPIEDWAKGITRAFSKRRKSHTANSINFEQPKRASTVSSSPLEHESNVSSLKAQNVAATMPILSRPRTAMTLPNLPIEDWIEAIPSQKPIPLPRNPRRSSLIVASMTSQLPSCGTDHGVLIPPSPTSIDARTDWQSDADSERSMPNLIYQNRLDQCVDAALETQGTPVTQSAPSVLQSSSNQVLQVESIQPECTIGVEKLSLRSLFFGGTQVPRDQPLALPFASNSSINHSRPQSIASSVASFVTANEFAIEDDEQIEAQHPIVAEGVIETQTENKAIDTSEKLDSSLVPGLRFQHDPDTGIDEDYSSQDECIEEAGEDCNIRIVDMAEDVSFLEGSASTEPALEHCVPGDGSLADILFQVASSSPYTSSESEDATSLEDTSVSDRAESSSQSDLEQDIQLDHIRDSSSYGNLGLPVTDSQSDSISTYGESVSEIKRTRPARHYKMVNGRAVAFEPWRMPGQFDLRRYSSPGEDNDAASYISSSSSQRRGSFLRTDNRWTWMEQEAIAEV
ncbi:MAG: hypothetical protein GOMPHAMPRED_007866 [Gomphillus americanus]|uniref:Uncharacterized protein n=1 Tax=Gomphillus americanus TaxID=1940652 RepID=A0A8H3F031_9LECA|nr:MAG: hypothetical protein GOMPHAMPRED_007866 [Gomphillus americanus]